MRKVFLLATLMLVGIAYGGNFVDNNTALPANKVDRVAPTDPVHQWTANDANTVFGALGDLRTVAKRGVVNVKSFGATGDGVTDDQATIQAAIIATQGRTLYFPSGKYRVSSTLVISTTSHHFVGDYGGRSADGGTEIAFSGTGPCFQIGTDSGNPWDSNEYNGPQGQVFEQLWISHSAPDTSLVSAPGSGNVFKTGAYGIWDWRGGNIVLRNVGIEKFEASFVGVQSDIDNFDFVTSLYSKWGVYAGPRSDQFTLRHFYSFSSDRALTIDRASQTRVQDAQLVGCGTSTTAAIEIRQGSGGTVVVRPWFEHLQGTGYQGTDGLAFVSAGEVAGYSSGGSISSSGITPTTTAVQGLDVDDPLILTELGGTNAHIKYIIAVGKAQSLTLRHPMPMRGTALTNLDALTGVQAAQTPSNSDTQISLSEVTSSLAFSKMFTNAGAGSPDVSIIAQGPSGQMTWTTTRHHFKTIGAAAGADDVQLSQEGNAGEVWLSTPNLASGQTTRLRLARSLQPGSSGAAPSSGTWVQGDRVFVTDPAAGGYAAWVCVTGGTPGTWVKEGLMAGTSGTLTIPNSSVIGASTASVTSLNGTLNVTPAAGTTAVNSTNSASTQTSTNATLKGLQNGTYDTTGGFISSIGMQGQSVSTRSAGASTLQNIGGQFTASGAQDNVAVQTVNGDVQLNTTSGALVVNRSARFSNELSPSALGADQNDYSPANLGDAYDLMLSASVANVNITGIAGGSAGRDLFVYNIGSSNTITLKHQSASSSAGNRIIGWGNADVVLNPGKGVLLRYSTSQSRWVVRESP